MPQNHIDPIDILQRLFTIDDARPGAGKGNDNGSEYDEGKQNRENLPERALYGGRLYPDGGCRGGIACFLFHRTGRF